MQGGCGAVPMGVPFQQFGGCGGAYSQFGGSGGGSMQQVPYGMPTMYAMQYYMMAPGASIGGGGGMPMAPPSGMPGGPAGPCSGPSAGPCGMPPAPSTPARGGGFPIQQLPTSPEKRQLILSEVVRQLNFWFGQDNLIRDMHLRRNMSTEGWVQLEVLAGFRKMVALKTDIIPFIVEAVASVPKLELDPAGTSVRVKDNWKDWVLPAPTGGAEPGQVPAAAGGRS